MSSAGVIWWTRSNSLRYSGKDDGNTLWDNVSVYCFKSDTFLVEESDKVHIVRNEVNGKICVKKSVAPEQWDIYNFLKENPNPYIPRIYECIQTERELIIVEEYFAGKNLEDELRKRDFSEQEAANIIIGLCRGLRPLHRAKPQIICRDLKPENVVFTNEGEVKLIDFDIARFYQPGNVKDTIMMGTEGYAAPEQFGFGQTDERSDIYGLGALLNYLLVQSFPVEKITTGRLNSIVRKCVSMNPKDRYQNVDELMRALEYAVDVKTEGKDMESGASYRIPGFRSKKLWKMIVAVAGYLFITALCFSTNISDGKGNPLPQAEQMFERFMIWGSQIFFVFFVCDYRGIRRKIPVANQRNLGVRLIVYVAAEFIFLFMTVVICVTVEMLIG